MNWLTIDFKHLIENFECRECKKGLIRIFLGNKTESSINTANSNGYCIAIIFPKQLLSVNSTIKFISDSGRWRLNEMLLVRFDEYGRIFDEDQLQITEDAQFS